MSLRRRRAAAPSREEEDDDSDPMGGGDYSGSDADFSAEVPSPMAPAESSHTTGENKLHKLLKRLFFGTSLLFALIFILYCGHLTTLVCVLIAQARRTRRWQETPTPPPAPPPPPARRRRERRVLLPAGAHVPRVGQRAVPDARGARDPALPHDAVGLVRHVRALLVWRLLL